MIHNDDIFFAIMGGLWVTVFIGITVTIYIACVAWKTKEFLGYGYTLSESIVKAKGFFE